MVILIIKQTDTQHGSAIDKLVKTLTKYKYKSIIKAVWVNKVLHQKAVTEFCLDSTKVRYQNLTYISDNLDSKFHN